MTRASTTRRSTTITGTAWRWADIDGDGLLDLYFTTQLGANELWRNLGEGKFADVTTAALKLENKVGVTASFGDTDNDGDPDLFATTVRGGNHFFENDGTGKFTDRTDESGLGYSGHSSAGVFFDYDRDGLLDLFLSNVGIYTHETETGRGGYFIGLDRGVLRPPVAGAIRAEHSVPEHRWQPL